MQDQTITEVERLFTALHQKIVDLPQEAAPAVLALVGGISLALGAKLATAGGPAAAATTECLSLAQVAKRTGVGKSTLRRMVDNSELQEGIHYGRAGRRLIFFWSALVEFLKTPRSAQTVERIEPEPFLRRGRRHG